MKKRNIISIALSSVLLALIGYGILALVRGYLQGTRVPAGFLEASGRIEGREYNAASKISGKVTDIFVEESNEVIAGQKIALIYSRQLDATLEQANAGSRKSQANLRLAEIEHNRYKRLLKEEAIPQAEFEQVENKYLTAKEDAISAEKEVSRLNADLEDTQIAAPIGGKVISRIVQPGEVIAAGTPVVTIVNMDDLYLRVFLPTETAGKVSTGDEAKIFADALPNESFEASVEKISQRAEFTPKNVETKTQRAKLVFEVKLKIKENKGHMLKPGMTAETAIKIDKNSSWDAYNRR